MSSSAQSAVRLRGVIFDMDGVLVDSHPVHRKAWRIFLQTMGRTVTDAELNFILDGRKRSDILTHFLGNLPQEELERHGQRKDAIFRRMHLEVAPIAGAVRLVHELHKAGMGLALATSASRSRVDSTLIQLGLEDCFSAIVTGDDVSLGKPDPAIYRAACGQLAVDPSCGLAVEDAVSGIEAATRAGLGCIGVASNQPAEKLAEAGAMHVVQDFSGLSAATLEEILHHSESAVSANAKH